MIDVLVETDEAFDPDQAEADERIEPIAESEDPADPLASLCWTWRDIQQARLAAEQRGFKTTLANELLAVETRVGRQIAKEIRRRPIWSWLSQYPGLGGVHTARLVALIGDARRFPGQGCTGTKRHHVAPLYFVGDPCPVLIWRDGGQVPCDGVMLEPRPHTGVASLYHYLGLHVVDGHSPRKSKGQKADWNPIGRTICLQPGGLAEQIVRLRVPKYREIYDATKERLARERGAVLLPEIVGPVDSALLVGLDAEDALEATQQAGLKPYQIDAIARKVAVKAFVGDLLVEMKRLAA